MSYKILDVALDADCEGDLVLGDMGNGMPFRAGSFDGAVRYQIYSGSYFVVNINLIIGF